MNGYVICYFSIANCQLLIMSFVPGYIFSINHPCVAQRVQQIIIHRKNS